MDTSEPVTPPIPLTILTGFLGAGKTTLLNRILHGSPGQRIAVLVNDFGSINIDSQLVVGVAEDAVSLTNGCICCTIRDDLLTTALSIVQQPDPPERLVIEASGISDPWAVAETFLLPEIRSHTRLDTIIAVVDAEQVYQEFALKPAYSALIVNQVAVADMVILNKNDLVDVATRVALHEWVRRIVPNARILEAVHADVPLELLLGSDAVLHQHHHDHDHAHHHDHDHGTQFQTWSYAATRPFARNAVRDLLKTLPTGIFRAKGVLWIAETPERRALLHLVGSRVQLTFGEPWGDTPPQSQLIGIGLPEAVNPDDLTQRLDACLVDAVPGERTAEPLNFLRSVQEA
ncbi:MAG: CobW family GTP-binding protein [Chloroflexaceae bacterium]